MEVQRKYWEKKTLLNEYFMILHNHIGTPEDRKVLEKDFDCECEQRK